MKKIISLLLALVMIATLSVSVFAEEEKGSITINGVHEEGNTVYEIYKLLDLESYDTDAGAYSYKVNAAWTALFATDGAKAYFTVAEDGYVTWTWKAAEGSDKTEEEALAEFAKSALAYAKEKGILPVQSSDPTRGTIGENDFVITGSTGVFDDLELGYYLVDSNVGALCGLTTTNPDASIQAKNGAPTVDKQVFEDSTQQWGDHNSADIGQIVEFRATISVHAGAQNYVLHDVMSDGLTFKEITKVEHVIPGSKTETVTTADYELKDPSTCGKADCTFEVHFSKELCDKLQTNDKIIVTYTAMLNREAIIANDGTPNGAYVSYGEGHKTTPDKTHTYSFKIDIVKTDSQNTLIDGAKFKIYDAATGGKEVPVVILKEADDKTVVTDANGNPMYRRAKEGEEGVEIEVKDGKVTVIGFDNGTYYLEETEAPDGYNKLTARQRFIIGDANLDATFNNNIFSTGSGVHVVNKTGSMLPETGAEGTILFIVIGAIAVLGAGVLLVTKKRMSMIED